MQKCSSCNNAAPTVHVMDLQGGKIVGSQYLCEPCAANKGVVKGQAAGAKVTSEILEGLLGGLQDQAQKAAATHDDHHHCSGCGLSAGDFRRRGRLGCPQCYDAFRDALLPLLERVHDATSHKGRFPGRSASGAALRISITELRNRLDQAIEAEHYEEAAEIRDQLQQAIDKREADKA